MTRQFFLTSASVVAVAVGLFALFFPALLQESKGTMPNNATYVWTSEVGILLLAIGIMAFQFRKEANSKMFKSFLFGNFIIQMGLFLIELAAYIHGTITKLSGIVPNLTLHVLLAAGFLHFCIGIKREDSRKIG